MLASSSGGCIQLIVGESGGWKTAADYSVQYEGYYVANNYDDNGGTATGTDIFDVCGGAGSLTNTYPISFEAWIDGDVSSTSIYKNVIWQYEFEPSNGDGMTSLSGASYWSGDKGAITELAVTTSGQAGNITSGTCSLYGF